MDLQGVRGEAIFEHIENLCIDNVTINGIRQNDVTEDIGELPDSASIAVE